MRNLDHAVASILKRERQQQALDSFLDEMVGAVTTQLSATEIEAINARAAALHEARSEGKTIIEGDYVVVSNAR